VANNVCVHQQLQGTYSEEQSDVPYNALRC